MWQTIVENKIAFIGAFSIIAIYFFGVYAFIQWGNTLPAKTSNEWVVYDKVYNRMFVTAVPYNFVEKNEYEVLGQLNE